MAVWFPQIHGAELGALGLAFLPIAVQEMVFGVDLIIKGFDSKAIVELSAPPRRQPEASTPTDGTVGSSGVPAFRAS